MDLVFRFGLSAVSLLGFQLVSATARAQPPDGPPPAEAPPVPDAAALVSPSATEPASSPPATSPPAPPAAPESVAPDSSAHTETVEESSSGTGFYGEVSLGVGAPWGGNTTDRFSQGAGATVAAGYAFHPNVGVNLFSHYNRMHVARRVSAVKADINEGEVRLYGIEARGFLGKDGPVRAWGSAGVAFGSGKSKFGATVDGTKFQNEATADFAFMPVVAFGADARMGSGFRLGPQVRWYLTSVDQVCLNDDCTADTSNEVTPDIVYLGLTLTYLQQ